MIQQAPRDPPETAADLQKKNLWRVEWEKEMVGKLATEMMDAACAELETRMQLEKQDWEAQALQKLDEQVEGVRQFFEPKLNEALAAARNAEAHANKQTELSNQLWTNFQAKQQEVDLLQFHLNAATTSSIQGLAKEQQNNAVALLNQKDLEINRLGDNLTKANSEVDYNIKARDGVVKEAENHVEEIQKLEERLEVVRGVNRDLYSDGVEKDRKIHQLEKALEGVQNLSESSQESQNLEERLEVVRAVNRDLYSAGVEKDQKIYQLEMAIERARNLSEANQELTKGLSQSDEESQTLTQSPNISRKASNNARLLNKTMAKSSRNERLVHKLRRKLANQEKESATILMALKTEMTASLKEALEEKKKVVCKLAIMQDSEHLVQVKKEHQIFEQRNKDMARKITEDAADIARLTTQNKLLHSTIQILLQESRRLELRGDSYKAKLAIESNILDDANSRIAKLTNAIYARDNKLAKTVEAQDAKIKVYEKTVREGEKTILMLRQWDAESGVTERDQLIKERDQLIKEQEQTIKQYKKDEKGFLERTETLERELLKHQNLSLIENISGWILGHRPFKQFSPSRPPKK